MAKPWEPCLRRVVNQAQRVPFPLGGFFLSPHTFQNRVDDPRLSDKGDPLHSPLALWAGKDIHPKDLEQQRGPRNPAAPHRSSFSFFLFVLPFRSSFSFFLIATGAPTEGFFFLRRLGDHQRSPPQKRGHGTGGRVAVYRCSSVCIGGCPWLFLEGPSPDSRWVFGGDQTDSSHTQQGLPGNSVRNRFLPRSPKRLLGSRPFVPSQE